MLHDPKLERQAIPRAPADEPKELVSSFLPDEGDRKGASGEDGLHVGSWATVLLRHQSPRRAAISIQAEDVPNPTRLDPAS